MNRPQCFRCRYLAITWDKRQPYACKGMGFKSKQIPSLVVRRDSGADCRMFSPKPGGAGSKTGGSGRGGSGRFV